MPVYRGYPLDPASADYPAPSALYYFDGDATDSSGNGYDLTAGFPANARWMRQGCLTPNSDLGYTGLSHLDFGSDPEYTDTDTALNIQGSMACMALTQANIQAGGQTQFDLVQWGGSGETEATNFAWSLNGVYATAYTFNIRCIWEYGAGVNVVTIGTVNVPVGLWVVVGWRRVNNGDGTSDLTLYVNDGQAETFAGLTNPSGGGSAHLMACGADYVSGRESGNVAQVAVWDQNITEAQYFAAVRRLLPRTTNE